MHNVGESASFSVPGERFLSIHWLQEQLDQAGMAYQRFSQSSLIPAKFLASFFFDSISAFRSIVIRCVSGDPAP